MDAPTEARTLVRVGELHVVQGSGSLVTIGLGSCVAVALYDAEARIGGLAHVMLPDTKRARSEVPPARVASYAITLLLEKMAETGAVLGRIRARLVGGASMFEAVMTHDVKGLGLRNIESCRSALEREGVPIDAEEVGGTHGRSVFFDVNTGVLRVSTVLRGDVTL
jgi:chemotaxis protein CheD